MADLLGGESIRAQTGFTGVTRMEHKSEKARVWAGEMAQRVKELAAKPADLNLIPSIHMAEGEKRLPPS